MANPSRTRPPIAVVGVSALFPGSTDGDGFWRDILAGKDLISDVPTSHWLPEDYYDADPSAPDKTYARRGGFLEKVDFDALGWGVPPSIIPATDTSQLLALIVAERVLRDATREGFETSDRSRTSVILGVTSAQELLATMVSRLQRPVWVKSLREHGLPESQVQEVCDRIAGHYQPWQESSFPGLLGNVVAGRIANRLDLGGTNCVTDAACASTFSALHMAVNELYLGDSDMVITGGVDTLNDIFMFMCFSKTPALSMSGDVRPFSDSADGTMLGEGLGMVALKRLDDAERDGDRIYAVIRGVGSSSDGRSKSVYAPVSAGQSNALTRAYEAADFDASTVELVEAHGTGTKAGDKAEFGGLELAFGGDESKRQWCALGTVKSQIGHTKAAAGAAGLFKAVMALHHKVLPPTIKVAKPNPALELASSPFYLNTEARPWIRPSDHPRRAGVSSFGFGGSNFHVAVEEYTGDLRPGRVRSLEAELVLLGGDSGADVAARARALAARCETSGLERLAWESAQEWTTTAHARLAVVATDAADLQNKLTRLAAVIDGAPNEAFARPDGSAYGVGAHEGDVAFVFPGQGSQYVTMGAQLAMNFDAARGPWDRAASTEWAGLRLDAVVHPLPRFSEEDRVADADRLRSTEWAQPGIGCTSLSVLAMMRALGVQAQAVAGHSFGELTALHAAGVLSEQDFLAAARRRGEVMAAAADVPGGMIAVSAPVDAVRAAMVDGVVVANENAPNQTVVSGPLEAIDRAEKAFADAGLRCTRLSVATAFHSEVVAGGVAPFGEFLAGVEFGDAEVPVWSGELAAPYAADGAEKRSVLTQQIARPVRWTSVVEGLAAQGVRTFVEVGPGSVLTGLVGRTLKEQPHRAVTMDRKGKDGVVALLRGVAQLAAAGVALTPTALWEGYEEPVDPATVAAPRLAVPINGANYDKAYPPEGGAAALPAPNPERVEPAVTQVAPAPVAPSVSAPVSAPIPAQVAVSAPVATPTSPAPRTPVAMTAAPAVSAPADAGWIAAWEEAQRQNAQAHAAFQQAMASSHSSFMQTVEASFSTLASLNGGAVPTVTAAPVFAAPMPAPVVPAPAPVVVPPPAPVVAPAPVPVV
ncbi:MAG: acyltransferase domain-containing protein, partial [Deltaproteobacteria bacterium]|nr:acyltransferase domain-containing protein [Deltaproteobacteria bacterium]